MGKYRKVGINGLIVVISFLNKGFKVCVRRKEVLSSLDSVVYRGGSWGWVLKEVFREGRVGISFFSLGCFIGWVELKGYRLV